MKPKRVSGQGEELEITLCNLHSMTERARARFTCVSSISRKPSHSQSQKALEDAGRDGFRKISGRVDAVIMTGKLA